jgi:hypothetical protein
MHTRAVEKLWQTQVKRLTRSVQLTVEIDRICAMTTPCAQLREGSLKLFICFSLDLKQECV